MRLRPPAAVRAICAELARAGHEAWCVGGAVRDALLGIETQDWDVATSARPEQVQALFRRTVPVGIQFGTVGVFGSDGVLHEVTTFRHDVETDGRHAVVRFGASLEEDLARRDFTINAIAVHAETLELRDPFDGRGDLQRRLVRCVGDAQQRMAEDRLRALRALRFAGRFDFALDPATWQAIRASAPELRRLSMERVKQELEKVMDQVARPSATLERYREAGIFDAVVPLLATAAAARFRAVDALPRPGLPRRPDRRLLRLAALFAEPGVAPPQGLERTLKALKFSNAESRQTITMVTALGRASWREVLTLPPVALRRFIAGAGRTAVPGIARLLWARAAADGAGADERRRGLALYRQALRAAYRDPLAIGDLALDGEDLLQAGVARGEALGDTLRYLLDLVLEDPARNTRVALQEAVRQRVQTR